MGKTTLSCRILPKPHGRLLKVVCNKFMSAMDLIIQCEMMSDRNHLEGVIVRGDSTLNLSPKEGQLSCQMHCLRNS